MTLLTIADGEYVVKEGDVARISFLLSGVVNCERNRQRPDLTLITHEAGQYFGDVAMFLLSVSTSLPAVELLKLLPFPNCIIFPHPALLALDQLITCVCCVVPHRYYRFSETLRLSRRISRMEEVELYSSADWTSTWH